MPKVYHRRIAEVFRTPITLRAEQEDTTPQEVVDKYHESFLEAWERLGITFDIFTTTGTENHRAVTHDIFLALQKRGLIYTDIMLVSYCEHHHRFLPDRYVKGTCPHCGNIDARADQCDSCGRPLNPEELIQPRCRLCGNPLEIRESEHFFLKLSALQERLQEWVVPRKFWRPNVLNFTRRYLEEGLRDRAISRDIEWGVPLPVPGYESKRIYVWFEAVIGYLSASKEWSQRQGTPERWREWWEDPDARAYYFIGKDNIPFHTIIWPAMLMGYGDLNLPYDIPANEFLTIEGQPLSTSRDWAVWVPDYLERYEPDPLRYYLLAVMPETGDSDFSWREFIRRNNDELVATYGNLVHRVLTLTYRNFQGRVPEPGSLAEVDKALVARTEKALQEADGHLYECHFREALHSFMSLAQEVNRYLDAQAPWKTVGEDRQAAARALWTALVAISGLRVISSPFLPFSAEKLHRLLGSQALCKKKVGNCGLQSLARSWQHRSPCSASWTRRWWNGSCNA